MSKKLFEPTDINTLIQEAAKLESDASTNKPIKKQMVSFKSSQLIKKISECFAAGAEHVDFVSAGELSLHQLIEYLSELEPHPFNLHISTWAIKESASRSLLKLIEAGKIHHMFGVFDYRIKTIDGKSFQLIEKHFKQYALTKNHAKVIVLDFIYTQFTIVTSANLSNNPRIEAGFISTNASLAEFHKGWMKKVLNGQKVY